MAIIRNPFARRPGAVLATDERPANVADNCVADNCSAGFERVDTVGSKASSAISIRSLSSRRSQDTGEYKMSVVNDSGVYLPPSPIDPPTTWPRRLLSRTSTDTHSTASGEIEHFPISRESFDSYRRSFDICAKSPVVIADPPMRTSCDSSRCPRLPRSSLAAARTRRTGKPTPEDIFEDIGLNDSEPVEDHDEDSEDALAPTMNTALAPARRRGFFAKLGVDMVDTGTMASRFLPGRKRTSSMSGQGAELSAWPAGTAGRERAVLS